MSSGRRVSEATRVDDQGVRLHPSFHGSADVYFDGQRVWSFASRRVASDGLVRWPSVLSRLLDGQAQVRVQHDSEVLFDRAVQFGTSRDRLRFVDTNGTPIIVDKWGLIQRPFDGRRAAGVVDAMTEMAERILRVMREDCGIDGWIAFGTLLGAARNGRAIGHDSDIDLCFLSEHQTPAEMIGELWTIARALRARGMRVQHKTGSFLTVRFPVPDGGQGGIDVYTCFFLDGLLYETATVRAPIPISAVLPLIEIEFEGRMLPAPADPEALLTASYGPDWRVPDPSFQHRPPPATVRRFDQWFGSLMRHRREWRHHNNELASNSAKASEFARWVSDQVPDRSQIIEVGSASGRDLRYYAKHGHDVLGLDYAAPNTRGVNRRVRKGGPRMGQERGRRAPVDAAREMSVNLYDLRDTLTMGALLSRGRAPKVICARELFETLEPDGRDNCAQLIAMSLRRGGTAYFEGRRLSREDADAWQAKFGGGKLWPTEPGTLERTFGARGGLVTYRDEGPARWRMIVKWGQ
ncbi:MAG: hypothetical protein ACRCYU_02790 [Nocardioides sp.]